MQSNLVSWILVVKMSKVELCDSNTPKHASRIFSCSILVKHPFWEQNKTIACVATADETVVSSTENMQI